MADAIFASANTQQVGLVFALKLFWIDTDINFDGITKKYLKFTIG